MKNDLKKVVTITILQILIVFFPELVIAQPNPAPNQYQGGIPLNFVRTWDAAAPQKHANDLMAKPLRQVNMSTQYLDGLGRPLQEVMQKGSIVTNPLDITFSGNATDVVKTHSYDGNGREVFNYLPYADVNNNGAFKNNPFNAQISFYNSQLTGQQNETNVGPNNLNWAYSKTNFEPSPLGRPLESYAQGHSWVGSENQMLEINRKSVKMKYWLNTLNDGVRIWTVTNSGTFGGLGSYQSTQIYAAGDLTKMVTVDENGKQVIEFTDKEGKVILKKVQLTAAADVGTGLNHDGWLCTYYIYDQLNNLRCVIQPSGVELVQQAGWVLIDATILAEQCFRYSYDQRNRLIVKKVPGAAEVYMLYDAKDRLVMTQDGNLRQSPEKWLVSLYDVWGRVIETGLLLNSYSGAPKTFNQHYLDALNSANYPFTTSTTPSPSSWEYLSKTGYDTYTTIPVASGLSSVFDNTWQANFINTYNSSPLFAQQQTSSQNTKGMITWSIVKVLGSSSNYLYSVNIYDAKGRIIQTKSKNMNGGVDVVTNQYNWSGQPLLMVQKQENMSSTTVLVTQMSYDDLGRLVKTEKRESHNGSSLTPFTTIAQNAYDALGQLKKKGLGKKRDAPPLPNLYAPVEEMTYDYNIRGWMLGANRDYAKDLNNNHFFGFDLGYDKQANGLINNQTYTLPQYNGNISGTVWKSRGDGEKRKFDYAYDAANRLLKADFTQYNSSVFAINTQFNFDVKMGTFNSTTGLSNNDAYDANGNILRMQQWGLKLTSSEQIDNLAYTYFDNNKSNKLKKVFDEGIAVANNGKLGDFKDGANTTGDDYVYDVNGNLILDNNKAISSIVYNHLNLPKQINVTGKGTIQYTYDAGGNKLRKTTTETGATVNNNNVPYTNQTIVTTTDYINGFVYESKSYSNSTLNFEIGYQNKLQFAAHEEGRIRALYELAAAGPNFLSGFVYDYMLKDHLGNVRAVVTDELKTQFYPAATLENETYNGGKAINEEAKFYTIDPSKVVPKSMATGIPTYDNFNVGYPNNNPFSNQTATSDKLYVLNAATNDVPSKTGLGIALKVMAGDVVYINGMSYHKKPVSGYTNTSQPLTVLDIMNLFANTGIGVSKGITGTTITGQAGFPTTLNNLLDNPPAQSSDRPRASINWVVLDEQFKYVDGGFDMVNSDGTGGGAYKMHNQIPPVTIPKNGYIYVYCSNESQYNVFFDNLQLVHEKSPLLEETHYYPFGLAMTGISSKAATTLSNNYKFNGGSELNGIFDVNYYETACRLYDPQIGRFWQVDELAESNWEWSPYMFSLNNPIRFNDPLGLDPELGLTAGTAKVLKEVVVYSIPKSFWAQKRAYYRINEQLERQGATIDRLEQESLRKMMERQDYDTRFRERVGAMTREGDKAFLNAVSWFIPGGFVTKTRYLAYAGNLFKLKRGTVIVKTTIQKGINKYGQQFGKELGKEVLANWGDPTGIDVNDAITSTLTGNSKIGLKLVGSVYNSFADASFKDGINIAGLVGDKNMDAVGRDLIFEGVKTYMGAAAGGSASERTQTAIDVMVDQGKKIISNAMEK